MLLLVFFTFFLVIILGVSDFFFYYNQPQTLKNSYTILDGELANNQINKKIKPVKVDWLVVFYYDNIGQWRYVRG